MNPAPPPFFDVRGLHKRFGDRVVLDSADLSVPQGAVVSLLGRSGTGKSVFLKCLKYAKECFYLLLIFP